jgi:hypothetical protein
LDALQAETITGLIAVAGITAAGIAAVRIEMASGIVVNSARKALRGIGHACVQL